MEFTLASHHGVCVGGGGVAEAEAELGGTVVP